MYLLENVLIYYNYRMIILIVFFALFSVFSHEGALYWDMECSTLLDQDLYQSLDDDSFLDEQLMIKLYITEASPRPSGKEPTVQQTSTNKQFTYMQTKFLISLMQNQLVEDGDDLPKSIQETNNCVYKRKGRKKKMWQEVANKLPGAFNEYFEWERVARK